MHIVFRVLNFLSTPSLSLNYKLSTDEKLLLIFLAKRSGEKGIFPSVKTLSTELNKSESAVRRSLKRLEQKSVITIVKKPGTSIRYFLNILEEKLSTAPSVHASTSVDAHNPWRPRYHPLSVDATLLKQLNKTGIKKEREHRAPRLARLSPLSDLFSPNEQNQKLCKSKFLDITLMTEKFKTYSKSVGKIYADEQAAFELFIISERQSPARETQNASMKEWGPGHPAWEEQQKSSKSKNFKQNQNQHHEQSEEHAENKNPENVRKTFMKTPGLTIGSVLKSRQEPQDKTEDCKLSLEKMRLNLIQKGLIDEQNKTVDRQAKH